MQLCSHLPSLHAWVARTAGSANLATAGCIVFSPSICPSCLGPSGLVAKALLMYELVYIAIAVFARLNLVNTNADRIGLRPLQRPTRAMVKWACQQTSSAKMQDGYMGTSM